MNNSIFFKIQKLRLYIKFKLEWEHSGKLTLLGVLLNALFKFSIYLRPSDIANYLHYLSGHLLYIKKLIVLPRPLQAYKIYDSEFLDREPDIIFETFSKLGYLVFLKPATFIHEKINL